MTKLAQRNQKGSDHFILMTRTLFLLIDGIVYCLIGVYGRELTVLYVSIDFRQTNERLLALASILVSSIKMALLSITLFFNQVTTKWNEALTEKALNFQMNTETMNGSVARLIPLS